MKEERQHNNLDATDKQSKAFFSGGSFHWSKEQDAIWAEMQGRLEKKPRKITLSFNSIKYAVAAVLMVLIGTTLFFRFYTTSIEVPRGQHQLAELPDASTVKLNALSSLKYKPYWWSFKREVEFEGEAYFEVEKGGKFTVISKMGRTEVLGTSFNIFSRDEVYKVTCITGSIRVLSTSKQSAVLKPKSKAEIKANGSIAVRENIDTYPEISWRQNIFLFNATPIGQVLREIERQYNVRIRADIEQHTLYSGNFDKGNDVETVLGFICPAMGFDYKKTGADQYLIMEEDE